MILFLKGVANVVNINVVLCCGSEDCKERIANPHTAPNPVPIPPRVPEVINPRPLFLPSATTHDRWTPESNFHDCLSPANRWGRRAHYTQPFVGPRPRVISFHGAERETGPGQCHDVTQPWSTA